MDDIAVQCTHLSKTYSVSTGAIQQIGSLLNPKKKRNVTYALRNVDLTLRRGEIIGIIGMNGSGKTTLSRIIAGITAPTSGTVVCNGAVNMLSATSGLNDYMTGLENIKYKCLLMGISKKRIQEVLPDIVAFADLGDYINRPLRTYSSGMKARLGFSISVFILPDILIVDEALSVGDTGFAAKCAVKMKQLREDRRTVLFVSHSVAQMDGFCDRVLWLYNGEKIAEDVPNRLILPYCAFAREYSAMTNDERKRFHPDVEEYQRRTLPPDLLSRSS